MMKKRMALFLGVILLVPALLIPGAAAGDDTPYLANIGPMEYTFVNTYYEDEAETILVEELEVMFKNFGPNPAYNVTATLCYLPVGIEAIDPDVTLGDMVVQGSASDIFIIRIYKDLVEDPSDTLKWAVEYDDPDGRRWTIPNVPQVWDPTFIPVPQYIPGSGSSTTATLDIKRMKIQWGNDNARWAWFKKDIFWVWGSIEFPEGYQYADLVKEATVSIEIDGSLGTDTVVPRERIRRRGAVWQYVGLNQPPGENMNITHMSLLWARQSSQKAQLYIRGILDLPGTGIDTQPAEATVKLEIPTTAGGSYTGEETLTFNVNTRWNRWIHR